MTEAPVIHQIPQETLKRFQTDFQDGSEKVLRMLLTDPTLFDVANHDMATIVTAPSVFQLCIDTAQYGKELGIKPIFEEFLTEVGKNFEGKEGAEYKVAISAVGGIAGKYIPYVLKVFGVSLDFKDIVKKVDQQVLAGMLAPEFNMDEGNYPNTLSKEEEVCLKVTIAMAQAGYIHSQLFRAIKEDKPGEEGRFDRTVFAINAVMKQRVFDKAKGDRPAKFKEVVSEVYKDVLQFKK